MADISGNKSMTPKGVGMEESIISKAGQSHRGEKFEPISVETAEHPALSASVGIPAMPQKERLEKISGPQPITSSTREGTRRNLQNYGITASTVDFDSKKDPAAQNLTLKEPPKALIQRNESQEAAGIGDTPKRTSSITDDFLRGFWEDYEDKQNTTDIQYTGNWETVYPDDFESGFQIFAQEYIQPETYEELKEAYERAKDEYDAVLNEMQRYEYESNDPHFMNSSWYKLLSGEYIRALEQYDALKEQYAATRQEMERSERQSKQKAFLDEYSKLVMLPDSPLANYMYHFGNQRTKAGGVLAGTIEDYLGSIVSAAGTLGQTALENNKFHQTAEVLEYLMDATEFDNAFLEGLLGNERRINDLAIDLMQDIRDGGKTLSDEGKSLVQDQKEGLNRFEQVAVDVGDAATRMLLDIGIGTWLGIGMAIPAAIRTFGSSAEVAAENDADLDQQVLYAATAASITCGIEQLCNLAFAGLKVAAPGITDDILTKGVEQLAQRFSGNPIGANALKNLGMIFLSGAGEGLEELLEGLVEPFLRRLIYDEDAETILQNPKMFGDIAYEGLISSILGLFGGGVNTTVDLAENMFYDGIMPGKQVLDSVGISELEALSRLSFYQMVNAENAAGERIYSPVEFKGTVKVNGETRDVSRRVYQRRDIDFDYADDTMGMTNLERMQAGKPPIGTDGHPIQLHHILQIENGPMVEIREVTHQEYYSQLHGLIESGSSFRNDPVLNKQYNNFRYSYWKWRATQILGGDENVE